ncbi:hypothetical protein DLR11_14945 [Salmonella enterica subsp. salamae]|nr:hypothetical protein [Salmonella enterica subsp. salamae]EEO8344757.1 hypothetical protein [Salmonella enterica]
MHTTRNGKSARDELPFRPLKWREFITATVHAAHPYKDAASGILMLRQPGMETRCPAGAGQRQRSWLGAKHDSPGSRQGRRPV